jgi:alkanesulfonate monooxygenase SsuD/methylene tetrahydromethanopterin reductase-like flavin-dependent oxidoreductase (luciferase family)
MLLLAAIAERTRTMRLGTGVVQLPLNHPLRVAEEVATLDVLSGGRAELGVGRGADAVHFNGYGVPLAESRDRLVEGLRLTGKALAGELFAFDGVFHQVDRRLAIAPRPVQRAVPIRIAANSRETAELAGRLGYPVLLAAHINPLEQLRHMVPAYLKALADAGHEPGPDSVTLLLPVHVAETERAVVRDGGAMLGLYQRLLAYKINGGLAAAPPDLPEAERARFRTILAAIDALTLDEMRRSRAVFGTPDECARRLRELADELSVGRFICWFNLGGRRTHSQVVTAMELFAAEVMPRVDAAAVHSSGH